MIYFPKQRLSYTEKASKDFQWAKDVIDYLDTYYGGGNRDSFDDYKRKLSNYKLYNNDLTEADFTRECNPLGIEVGQFKDEIQPYNKAYNKINVLLGNQARERERTKLMHQYLVAQFQQEQQLFLSQFGEQNAKATDEDKQKAISQAHSNKEVMNPEEIQKYLRTSYSEAREIASNKLLKWLVRKERIKEKKNDGFKHGLISGEEFLWVGTRSGQPAVEIANPLGMVYHKSPEVKYVQDGLFAGYRKQMDIGQILDLYGDLMNPEDLAELESTYRGVSGIRADAIGPQMNYDHSSKLERRLISRASNSPTGSPDEGSYGKGDYEDMTVFHVEWKSQRKIGFLTFIDPESQQMDTMVVAEGFKLDKDLGHIDIEWTWIPEVWEGTRIGEHIFVGIKPKDIQFRSFHNPMECKLGYLGVVYNSMNAAPISMMDRMKPFQYLYFFVMHKCKKLIARDRGVVFDLDISMVDPKVGLEKTLYYLDEMDLNVRNPFANYDNSIMGSAMTKIQRPALGGAVSRSNTQHIVHYITILEYIDQQIGDVAGIPKHREGATSPYDPVSNVQQNIIQSSHITEIYFLSHDLLWEQALTQLLQVAQHIYAEDPLNTPLVLDDQSVQSLSFGGSEFSDADLAVFVGDSTEDRQILETLKQLAHSFIQNDKAKVSDVVKMLKTKSVEEIQQGIEIAEEKAQQQQQQQQQQEFEHAEKLEQMRIEDREDQQAHDIVLKQMEIQGRKEVAMITGIGFDTDKDRNRNQIPDILEVDTFLEKAANDKRRLDLQEQKQKSDEKDKQKKAELKEKELRIKEKQASIKKKLKG